MQMPPEKENTLAIDKKEVTKNMSAELGDIYMRPGQTQTGMNLHLSCRSGFVLVSCKYSLTNRLQKVSLQFTFQL